MLRSANGMAQPCLDNF